MSRSQIKNRAKPIKLAKRRQNFLGLSVLVGAMFFSLFWQANYAGWFSGGLKVWIFDVGQGDAIFMETPSGKQILLDTGMSDNTVLTKLGQVMRPWDRYIDEVIITHPHADHEGGLAEVLRRYQVGKIYKTGALGYDDLQAVVRELSAEDDVPIIFISEKNSTDELGDRLAGFSLKLLAPDIYWENKKIDNLNNSSVVLLLAYGETSILLTGDAAFEEEPEILSDIIEPVDVLKIAHHGSVTSTSGNFLEAVLPRFAIISVGIDNDYGHPNPATLERLRARGIVTLRTDLDGDILITSNGGEPTVKSRPLPF